MAVSKEISTTSLAIEVESGVDSSGNATYSKKSFSGVKDGADPEKVYAVAEAIKGVIGANTRYYYLTEVSLLKSEQSKWKIENEKLRGFFINYQLKRGVFYGIYFINDFFNFYRGKNNDVSF